MGGHDAHLEQLDERFAALEQAVALEQGLLLERFEMLRDGMDEIGVGNILGNEIVLILVQRARDQLFEPAPGFLNGGASRPAWLP